MWRDATEPQVVTVYDALHSPSVRAAGTAFERRVALAVHEAKQGALKCGACGFANVVRAVSCVRCSATLVSTTHWTNVTNLLAGRSRRGRPVDAQALRLDQTALQQRIRRRYEWTRKVNGDCTLVWHHDETLCDSAFIGFPSYVLQSESKTLPASPGNVPFEALESPVVKVETIADVAAGLKAALELRATKITNAGAADASHIAYAMRTSSITTASARTILTVDTATNAQLPFPTKLAQFITSMAGIVGAASTLADTASSRLELTRDSLLADSIGFLATLPPALLGANIRVQFLGEQGIDAGGVYREWFLLTNEAVITPEAGIFTCVDHQNQSFYLNPHSREILGDDHLAHFLAAGRLLGRALLDGNVTGFHLAMPLLKIILGQPVGFVDLQYFDPEMYKHLKWLLENDGVEALSLDFTVTEKLPHGSSRTVELVPGGAEVEVDDANKADFVDAKLTYVLFESVSEQLFAFLTGVYEVVPAESLAIFDAEELDYVVSGSDEIDVDDWEANTLASKNLMAHISLEYFWRAVHELSTQERRILLQFATASARVPPGGFCALASYDGKLCLFNLRGVDPKMTRGYLHSHACFNRLDLPRHTSFDLMRQAVRAAITSDTSGFTTN